MSKVLIIDPDEIFYVRLSERINQLGHRVVQTHTLKAGIKEIRSGTIDVVFLCPRLPDGNGLEALPAILGMPPHPEAVVISDTGDPEEAELAVRSGAWDYIEKTVPEGKLILLLIRALQYQEEKKAWSPSAPVNREVFKGIIGNSPKLRACIDLMARAANSGANILITGETGTGKELFAWAIHNISPRSKKNFVIVDCAALPETLVESTLFGYEKGAFTGADKTQSGLIAQADGGTLFLDEVGELPPSIQRSFLRVLQERRFRIVGGRQEITSNFRLIAASNRNLDQMVRNKQFRKDLLFRLRSFTIELPSLRERIEDVHELAAHHLKTLCRDYQLAEKRFAPEFLDVLASYGWPGNVRELVNALERAVVAARREPVLFPKHLPTYLRIQVARSSVSPGLLEPKPGKSADLSKSLARLKDLRSAALAKVERQYLKDLMSLTQGDIGKSCQISGLSRSRLYYLLKKYHLSPTE